jgi:hypothetical protein
MPSREDFSFFGAKKEISGLLVSGGKNHGHIVYSGL